MFVFRGHHNRPPFLRGVVIGMIPPLSPAPARRLHALSHCRRQQQPPARAHRPQHRPGTGQRRQHPLDRRRRQYDRGGDAAGPRFLSLRLRRPPRQRRPQPRAPAKTKRHPNPGLRHPDEALQGLQPRRTVSDIQAGDNIRLEDCYAEGSMRATTEMLRDTSGPAFTSAPSTPIATAAT